MIWIVDIPPEYDGLEIVSPAITYILHNEPSAVVLALVNARGGSISAFGDPYDGGGNVSVTVDGDNAPLTDLGGGDYSFDPPDQYETEVEITIDDGAGSSVSVEYQLYQPYNIVIGNQAPSLPLWATSGTSSNIHQVDNDDGSVLNTITDSNFSDLSELAEPSNFVTSDDGYFYVIYVVGGHAHIIMADPDGNDSEILDYADFNGNTAILAYDRIQDVLYSEIPGPDQGDLTKYSFTKAGVSLGSVTRETWFTTMSGMAAYNGNLIYVLKVEFGYDDHSIMTYGGETILDLGISVYGWTGDIVASNDGHVYALYSDNSNSDLHLVKVHPDTGLVWTYDFPSAYAKDLNGFRKLWTNDNGVSLVNLKDGATVKTFKISSAGELVWEKTGRIMAIDNNESYYQ